uniref:Uncharacterized protein n=1 Tax=Timema tahoe TaxID=61484 RepID=A0A7R9NZL6_9NEOP|nr:unnamed protein product [Timema tahoe]
MGLQKLDPLQMFIINIMFVETKKLVN